MGIRTLLLSTAAIVALSAAADPAAQDAQSAATFRSGVDVITVDVGVVDKQGRPIDDLRAADFSIKVDGRSRPVVSAQLVKVDSSKSDVAASLAPADALVSTNVGPAGGRRIAIAVDQTLIAPGSIATVLRSASRFVDALAPADYAALLAFPEPGPRVDFTTDKSAILQKLPSIVGQPQKMRTTTFDLSPLEAQAIYGNERLSYNPNAQTAEAVLMSLGPEMHRVIARGCKMLTLDELKESAHLSDLKGCVRDMILEAGDEALDIRVDTAMTLQRLESYLKELATLDGPKTLILISAGLIAEDAALEEVWRLAADARTTVHVIAVDRERERDHTGLAESGMKLQNRALETQGLETIADATGGGFYRAVGAATGAFDQLALELSASYIIGIERRAGDPDRQRINVEVKRRGAIVRSPASVTVTSAVNARRKPEDLLSEALGAPLPLPGVPMSLSTFRRRGSAAGTYRLHLAAQIGAPGAAGGSFSLGYAVVDQRNRVVTSAGTRIDLIASGRPNQPLEYDTSLDLPPGAYSVRFAVVDGSGRRGMAVRPVELPTLGGDALMTSDLVVGALAPDVETLTVHPSVEPHVEGRIAAHLEIYPSAGDRGTLKVNLEVAEGVASPPLRTAVLNLTAGSQPDSLVASGGIDAALLPARYVARAVVLRDGVPVLTVTRPFVLERSGSGPAPPGSASRRVSATPLSSEVKGRTAVYVTAFVRGLSNVVGEEDFALSGPTRRVISDFLLVPHPASPRDFLTYRDVTHVNGVPVPNHEERLADLFVNPTGPLSERVRQITLAAEQQVPSILDPIFVLAFLQADLQPRFELTESAAGGEWPPGVKAVTFVEVARPTMLRGGPLGNQDVPVRGTAWIEPETGRVLQTELVVNTGRVTKIVTRFALDRRLQIMVPEQMRSENPDGVATYSNFRRFSVQTDTAVAPPN